MAIESLSRAIGTSHPVARDPISEAKPRLLVLTSSPALSLMSGRDLNEVGHTADNMIETERLLLRPLDQDDFPAYFAMMADPASFAFSHRGALTSDEAWTRLLRQSGHWSLLGYGQFAVIEKASGKFIGEVGFGDFRRDLGGEFDHCPEASWTVIEEARGKGYATEAAHGAVKWLERHRGTRSTVCIIHSRNRSSLRIAHKLGFKPFRYAEYRGYPAIFLKRNAMGFRF